MALLLRRLNYRNIILDKNNLEAETIGVYRKDGELSYYRFMGFVEREDTALMTGAKPVKLNVASYSEQDSFPADWTPVPNGFAIQGCMIGRGVYAVVENGVPRIVVLSH